MPLVKRGKHRYGDDQTDIRAELIRYIDVNAYPISHFSDCVCHCGSRRFRLRLDEAEGVAIRDCAACGGEHVIGDSEEFLGDVELEECGCPCGEAFFEITAGASLYEGSEDVRWFYLGCRCPACGLTSCYGDWKNEYEGYEGLLGRI